MKADLKREIPEVHSLNVGKLLKTVELAAKKEGIKILPYEVVEPVSARGNPLEKVPLTQNDSVGVQGIHLPFHFCCVVVTSGQLREAVDAGEDNVACAMYLNSLNRSTDPRLRSAASINSPILQDMVAGTSDFVTDLPCVQQPDGHACGMATLVNSALALLVQSHNELLDGGIDKALSRFQLPYRSAWTNSDFVSATRIIVKFFEDGPDGIPKLSIVLRRMSLAIAEARSKTQEKRNKSKKSRTAKAIATGSQGRIDTFFKKKNA